MITRVLLFLLLSILLSRAFWRIVASFMEGLTGRDARPSAPLQQGVHMVRDPVCGTFVLPERAVALVDGHTRLFFCSDACRDKYRASTGSGRPDPSTSSGSPRAKSRGERVAGRSA